VADRRSARLDPAGGDPADRGDRERVQAILAEAEQTDAAGDAAFGADLRGDELPPRWAERAGRPAPIRAALARIGAEQTAREAQRHAEQAARAERDAAALAEAEQALAAEVARRQTARDA
jgi:hypothetical protein